jgi:membrane protease YdiL (CAAX protease family)
VFWGLNWATWTFAWYMGSMYPSDLWFFFLYVPFLSGVLLTAIIDGRSGLRAFFGRMFRWRVGLQWYAVALFLPLAIRLAAMGLNLLAGASLAAPLEWPGWATLLSSFLFPSLLLISLGEEPGFRGFALPRLLVGRSALSASLILGVLHAIWHIPLFVFGGETPLIFIIAICGGVLNTWLFNNTRGSVLINILLHASINTMVDIFNPLFAGADASRHLIMQTVVFVAIAVLLPILFGKELGRQPQAGTPAITAERSLAAK